MDLTEAAAKLLESPSRGFAVSLWNGVTLAPSRDEGIRGRVLFRDPSALEALLPPVSERRVAEAFIDGHIELEGDAIGLIEAATRWEGPRLRPSLAPPALALFLRRTLASAGPDALMARLRGRTHSPSRDREAIQHHYDLSDDFYRLFLDPALVYSCAYFASGGERLEEAQRAKLELICRKLDVSRADRLLDVGCGWGALLEHAVARYQVSGLGITLSENQLAEARRRLAHTPSVSAIAADYRRLRPEEPFHKVASVGMMEHVGRARLGAYFAAIHRLMHPGGLFLNHAIADGVAGAATLPWVNRRRGGFIERYIFPDSELVAVGEVVTAAERAGFEVRDLESLREHYAETLAAWLARLEARFDEAVALVGLRRARAYRLYLASSAAAFRVGRISVFQLLLAKRSQNGRIQGVPRCRADWYAPGVTSAERQTAR